MESLSELIYQYHRTSESHVRDLQPPFHTDSLEDLAERIKDLTTHLIRIGDQAGEESSALALGIHFQWIEECKHVLVLWRDTLFQFQKARILQREGRIGDEEIIKLHASSQTLLARALEEEKRAFAALQKVVFSPRGAQRKLESWQQLNSAWDIYKQQMEDLGIQPDILIKQCNDLLDVSNAMTRIDDYTIEVVNRGRHGINHLLTLSQKAIDAIRTIEEPKKLVHELEAIEQLIRTTPSFESYNDRIEKELADYNSILQFPIDTQGGMIKHKDLNPSRSIRQWLEAEIFPSLTDAIEIMENVNSTFKMALVNLRNKVLHHVQEVDERSGLDAEDLEQPLLDATEDIRTWRAEYRTVRNIVLNRMQTDFYASQLYHPQREFLPLSYKSSLSQLSLEESPWVTRTKNWVDQKTQSLQEVRTAVLREEALSDAEKIVRYVKSRKIHENQHQYDSIFTAEGYIGDSFCVGRDKEIEHVENLINNWKEGYRGAVIIHGMRFAGKSLFGEMIAQRYFHSDALAIKPYTTLKAFGRRAEVRTDLGATLDWVTKYSGNRKKLIWIDDLEMWHSAEINMDQNLRSLMNHIDRFDHRFFYMISMNSWAMGYFDQMYGLNDVLETHINVNRMSLEEIKEALLIRHGATHKRLSNREGKEMTSSEFAKYAGEIYRLSSGNIGEALRLWASVTVVRDEDEVFVENIPTYSLPDFIDADKGILLRSLLLQKQTNEYQMLRQYGPAFRTKYKAIIQRLLGYGILIRQSSGMLAIAPGVVNDVSKLLAEHGHITIPALR